MTEQSSTLVLSEVVASPWKRYLAGLVDLIFCWFIALIIAQPIGAALLDYAEQRYEYAVKFVLPVAMFYLVIFLYSLCFHAFFSTTPAKHLLRLKVLQSMQQPLNFTVSIKRHLCELVFVLVLIAVLIYYYCAYLLPKALPPEGSSIN